MHRQSIRYCRYVWPILWRQCLLSRREVRIMLWHWVFWLSLAGSLGIGAILFRDLGDISQSFIRVKRENMLRTIRQEHRLMAIGLGLALLMALCHLAYDTGSGWAFWPAAVLVALFYGFPYVWIHIGLRNQQGTASYYSIDKARNFINPSTSMLVIENNGEAAAHSDYDLSRPHLASSAKGLGGEKHLIMTYCALANLGLGFKAEIDGRPIDFDVLAQHGNNLVLRDKETHEPIQHIYGQRICDLAANGHGQPDKYSPWERQGMPLWPTFRMSFRAFEKAYPNGHVFLNKPVSNPFLRLLDAGIDVLFAVLLGRHARENTPVIDNMTHYDDRLPNKTYIWGIALNGDAVAYTEDFVFEQDNVINVTIGGRAVVIAYDSKLESLGAWYNDSGQSVTRIDFNGRSDRGRLMRIEALRPGMFWHVWVEFFPATDINRLDKVSRQTVA